jgi:hypothetical protein
LAGGLNAGQQRAIAEPLIASVRAARRRAGGSGVRGGDVAHGPSESIELWRLLGALELLDVAVKQELGEIILELLPKPKQQPARGALSWALGRLGTRVPIYGPLNRVVPVEVVDGWIQSLIELRTADANDPVSVMLMARRTDDRYREISESRRREVLSWLGSRDAAEHLVKLVAEGGRLDREEQGRVFGESLPVGLRIA